MAGRSEVFSNLEFFVVKLAERLAPISRTRAETLALLSRVGRVPSSASMASPRGQPTAEDNAVIDILLGVLTASAAVAPLPAPPHPNVTTRSKKRRYKPHHPAPCQKLIAPFPKISEMTEQEIDIFNGHLDDTENIYAHPEDGPKSEALIINVYNVPDVAKTRHGSELDTGMIENMIRNLGQKPILLLDPTGAQIISHVEEFVNKDRHKHTAMTSVFLMGHGTKDKDNEECVVGSDGEYVKLSAITNKFGNSRKLFHKPKWIVIGTCRDEESDYGISCDAAPPATGRTTKYPTISIKSDMFITHSTSAGYKSFRSAKNGSPFIHSLVTMVSQYSYKYHLLDIIIKVHNDQKSRHIKNDDGRAIIQVPVTEFTSNKHIWLPEKRIEK